MAQQGQLEQKELKHVNVVVDGKDFGQHRHHGCHNRDEFLREACGNWCGRLHARSFASEWRGLDAWSRRLVVSRDSRVNY